MLTVERIREAVAADSGIDASAINERTRAGSVVPARQVAIYLARKLTKQSYAALARKFNRSRWNVMYSFKRISRLRCADIELDRYIDRLESALLGSPK